MHELLDGFFFFFFLGPCAHLFFLSFFSFVHDERGRREVVRGGLPLPFFFLTLPRPSFFFFFPLQVGRGWAEGGSERKVGVARGRCPLFFLFFFFLFPPGVRFVFLALLFPFSLSCGWGCGGEETAQRCVSFPLLSGLPIPFFSFFFPLHPPPIQQSSNRSRRGSLSLFFLLFLATLNPSFSSFLVVGETRMREAELMELTAHRSCFFFFFFSPRTAPLFP